MRQRQVYIDFGAGFVNVSHLVKYDTLTITHRAFNDSYRYAQNECSFDIIYDPTIFPLLRYATNDFAVRIVELFSDTCITTENDWFLTTEDSFRICTEADIAVPVFYGHIPPTTNRTYDGIIENTILRMEAIDDLDKLAVPVGDIVYANHAVLDPSNPSASIVHKLCSIAGFTDISSTVTIPTVISRFAPSEVESTVLETLNDLLYEYGYVLNLDESGVLTPILWNIPEGTTTVAVFDESNIVKSVSSSRDQKVYDSVKCIYYDLNSAQKVRLFTDGNCGFNADGTFSGYNILNNTYYPPEANVIDDTTGTNQVVEQEYTDDAIKYFTNKAIKENLDYNYKNFSSDFSAMVATENHFVDRRIDSGVTVVTETFGNKKCRVLYRNTSGSIKNIWYNNIYGDVWYKSTERSVTRTIKDAPKKEYSYTSKYIFTQAIADAFVQGLSAQFELGKVVFKFPSEKDYKEGTIVNIVTDDGTNQMCIIMERVWDEYNGMWDYVLVACSENKGELTARTSTVNVTVTPASPFSIQLSTGIINVPYNGATPDFTNCSVTVKVMRDGLDVTSDWTISAVPTNVTGAFSPANKYNISAISDINGSVQINATRTGWGTLTTLCNVVKAIGKQGATGPIGPKGPGLVYRGVGIPTSTTSSTFVNTPIQYVGGAWSFASASASKTADIGDLLFVRHFSGGTIDGTRKVYQWTGSSWNASVVTRDMLVSAASDLMDVCRIYGTPTNTADSAYVWYDTLVANQSFIDFLMVRSLQIKTGGKIYSGAGNYNNTDTPMYMDSTGKVSMGKHLVFDGNDLYLNGVLDTDAAFMKADLQVIGQDYMKAYVSPNMTINLVTGDITTIKNQLNSLVDSGEQLYGTEDYTNDRRRYCGVISGDDTKPIIQSTGGLLRICNYIDRYTEGGVVKYAIGFSYFSPNYSNSLKETSVYRPIISGNNFILGNLTESNILTIQYTTTGVTTYGSSYVEGSFVARRGVHQRKRGVQGSADTPFSTQDQVFQCAVTFCKQKQYTVTQLYYYNVACSVEMDTGLRYPGCLYMTSSNSVTIMHGTSATTCTSGNNSAVSIRYIYI